MLPTNVFVLEFWSREWNTTLFKFVREGFCISHFCSAWNSHTCTSLSSPMPLGCNVARTLVERKRKDAGMWRREASYCRKMVSPTQEANCSGQNICFFSKRCVPIQPTQIFIKAEKVMCLWAALVLSIRTTQYNFRQRPSEKMTKETPDQESFCSS